MSGSGSNQGREGLSKGQGRCKAWSGCGQEGVSKCREGISRVADPHHFNGDPDPAFHFKVMEICDSWSLIFFEPLMLLNFNLNADPDLAFTLIRFWIRIQRSKVK